MHIACSAVTHAHAKKTPVPKPNSCNLLPRPHDAHSKDKIMSFTTKMFRILTKRILTCLLKKRGAGIQHFGSK